jgi:nicotinamide-nucleotide amidase
MDLEVVTVGTELLLGFTIDSNAADIARALAEVGVRVVRRVTVADDEAAIRDAVAGALRRSGTVITTGGLGPTSDDRTKRVVARLFQAPLELDESYLEELTHRFAQFKRGPMPPSNRSQAEVPQGATVLPNRRGTAPGLILDGPLGTVVLMPGVPHEMRVMLNEQVLPLLTARREASGEPALVIRSRTLRTTGVTESGLASALMDAEGRLESVSVAYLPGVAGVDLRLTARRLSASAAEEALDRASHHLVSLLGARYYGRDDTDLAAVVLDALRRRDQTLAVAESCTGGLVGERITAIPGASDVFLGGTIAYANASKVRDLGVPAALLESEGAVSEAVALEMACGVAQRFRATAALGVTGIAGPGGATPGKPVGTVWLAGKVQHRERAVGYRIPGGRREVRGRAAQAALDLLRGLLVPE